YLKAAVVPRATEHRRCPRSTRPCPADAWSEAARPKSDLQVAPPHRPPHQTRVASAGRLGELSQPLRPQPVPCADQWSTIHRVRDWATTPDLLRAPVRSIPTLVSQHARPLSALWLPRVVLWHSRPECPPLSGPRAAETGLAALVAEMPPHATRQPRSRRKGRPDPPGRQRS